jgi:GxxExxY protein
LIETAKYAKYAKLMEEGILFKDASYRIVGACFEVHRERGCGFLEPVYQECMEIELEHLGIPFIPKKKLRLTCRDRVLRQHFEPDFVCFDKIILELKAVTELTDEHRAQRRKSHTAQPGASSIAVAQTGDLPCRQLAIGRNNADRQVATPPAARRRFQSSSHNAAAVHAIRASVIFISWTSPGTGSRAPPNNRRSRALPNAGLPGPDPHFPP